jgi:hypothetical protein
MDNNDLNQIAIAAGIPENYPQQSLRAVATYKLSEVFKLGLIPRTERFMRIDESGHANIGQAMEFVKGSVGMKKVALKNDPLDAATTQELNRLQNTVKTGDATQKAEAMKSLMTYQVYQTPDGTYYPKVPITDAEIQSLNFLLSKKNSKKPLSSDEQKELDSHTLINTKWYRLADRPIDINYNHVNVQKSLSDLQIFDIIIGHADRNAGNWIYAKDGTGGIIGVKGIDNDDTFGHKWQIEGTTGDPNESVTPDVPPVVDVSTAIKILGIDFDKHVSKLLEGLDPIEIAATKTRLDHVQGQIRARAQNGGIAALPGETDPGGKLEQLRILVNGQNGAALPALKTWGAGVRDLHDQSNSYLGKMIERAGANNKNVAPDNDQIVLM